MTMALRCPIPDCTRSRHKRGRLCSMHSERLRLTGKIGPAESTKRADGTGSIMTTGYMVLTGTDHPLATAQGKVLVHRVILFEKIGDGSHPCHWCGKVVTWQKGIRSDSLIVDHLDDDRLNNEPGNLVPACNRCNTTRGKTDAS